MSKEITLKDKCKEWIRKNIPRHTQAAYEELLEYNERLIIALIAKCIDYDNLVEAHVRLQDELFRETPFPTFTPSAEAWEMPMQMTKVFQIRWDIAPMKAAVAVDDRELLRDRYALNHEVARALRSHFLAEVAPKMWDEAQRTVMRQLA